MQSRQSIIVKALFRADEDHPASAPLSSLQRFVLNLEAGLREVRESPVRIITIRTAAQNNQYLSLRINARVAIEPELGSADAVADEDYITGGRLRRGGGKRHEVFGDFERARAGRRS